MIVNQNVYTAIIKGDNNVSRGGSRISSKGGGAHFKKMPRTEGVAKICGVFRLKNHDFTPKNHIFSNFRGGGG